MADLSKAKEKIGQFFTDELKKDKDALKFLEVTKTDAGWCGRVEVAERNIYLKKMGFPNVLDKNTYNVQLDPSLNVIGYKQEGNEKEEE